MLLLRGRPMNRPTKKLPRLVLWVFFVLVLFQSISLVIFYWPGALPDRVTSGAWVSLAYDFSKGIFYRPLLSETGYGGTRYMPLFFVLHGYLIRLFHDPVTTGVGLSLTAALLVGIGIYLVLRQLGLHWHVALPFAGAMNCTLSFQFETLNIRGDFLASALNIWAIWLALKSGQSKSKKHLALSGIFFILTFLTKFTSLFGLLAVVLLFHGSRQKRAVYRLLFVVGVGIGLSLSAIYLSSEGRAWESFASCATGGMGVADVFGFLFHFLKYAVRDPFFLGMLGYGLFVFVTNCRKHWWEFPYLFFATTLAFTLLINMSPGTGSNHLIDLQVALIVLSAVHFAKNERFAMGLSVGFLFIITYIVLSLHPSVYSIQKFFKENPKPTRANVQHLYDHYGEKAAPVLSDWPYFSILNGDRAVVGDHWNLRILMDKNPAIREDFMDKIKSQHFGSVVWSNWPGIFKKDIDSRDDPHLLERLEEFHRAQEGEFYKRIIQYYEITSVRRPFVYFSPKALRKTSP